MEDVLQAVDALRVQGSLKGQKLLLVHTVEPFRQLVQLVQRVEELIPEVPFQKFRITHHTGDARQLLFLADLIQLGIDVADICGGGGEVERNTHSAVPSSQVQDQHNMPPI